VAGRRDAYVGHPTQKSVVGEFVVFGWVAVVLVKLVDKGLRKAIIA